MHLVAALHQHRDRDLLVHGIVLREEDAQRAPGFRDGMTGHDLRGSGFRRRLRQHGAEGLEQIRARHRLGEIAADAQRAAALAVAALTRGGEHQQIGARQRALLAYHRRQLETIHVGHLDVEDREIVGCVLLDCAPDRVEPLAGGRDFIDLDAFRREHLPQDATIGLIVIDDQHPPPAERGDAGRALGDPGVDGQGEGE